MNYFDCIVTSVDLKTGIGTTLVGTSGPGPLVGRGGYYSSFALSPDNEAI